VGLSLVGEQGTRLITGALLALPLGVTGAFLGSILSYIAMSLYCQGKLRAYAVGAASTEPTDVTGFPLRRHIWLAWAPIAGLAVIAVLQNIDIIAAKHRFSTDTASAYAATAVAAKVMIWVAIGAAFYLVPEVSRRRAEGEDTRHVLGRAPAIVVVLSIPCLLIFAVAAKPLLTAVFGHKKATASDSLLILGLAFTVLACTYLAIQYMLALKRTRFLIAIALVAAVEPVLLFQASRKPAGFAAVVLAVQAVAALLAFALALRRDRAAPGPPGPPSADTKPDETASPTMVEVA
jgi:O-antigen/teichoic acid export membrane protein